MKIILISVWGVMLLAWLSLLLIATVAKKAELKKTALLILSCWLAYDLVLIVLAFMFGWFK